MASSDNPASMLVEQNAATLSLLHLVQLLAEKGLLDKEQLESLRDQWLFHLGQGVADGAARSVILAFDDALEGARVRHKPPVT